MSNYSFTVRAKRWTKFLFSCVWERLHGLDFSMVYVGLLQQNTPEFHGYSMTDAGDMKRMLQAVPIDPAGAAFLDVGCGKGMCMRCAAAAGYKRIAGLDLDPYLLKIARQNMARLHLHADCIEANAVEFAGYADYDVFYFYNPFGKPVFERVIQKIKDSQSERDRDIWIVYYHPVFGALFEGAGFAVCRELHDTTRDTTTRLYHLAKRDG